MSLKNQPKDVGREYEVIANNPKKRMDACDRKEIFPEVNKMPKY